MPWPSELLYAWRCLPAALGDRDEFEGLAEGLVRLEAPTQPAEFDVLVSLHNAVTGTGRVDLPMPSHASAAEVCDETLQELNHDSAYRAAELCQQLRRDGAASDFRFNPEYYPGQVRLMQNDREARYDKPLQKEGETVTASYCIVAKDVERLLEELLPRELRRKMEKLSRRRCRAGSERRWGDTAAFARILRILAECAQPVTTRGGSSAAESAGWLLEVLAKADSMGSPEELLDFLNEELVVQMLQAMSSKGKKELQEEKVQYARYAEWCKGTEEEKSKAIEASDSKIEVLTADIGKAATDAEVLGKEIEGHAAAAAELAAQESEATKVREDEAKDFVAEQKDYAESLDALDRAIETLDKQDYSRPQAGEAFAQFAASLGASRGAQDIQKLAAGGAPKAKAYDFQSGNITTMLKALKTKFSEEKVALEKAEASKAHSHELMVQSLKSQADAEKQDQSRKATLKSKKLALKASMEDEKNTATSSKDADTKYLDDVTSTCRQKAADFESNQKIRSEELQAVQKAVTVVSQKLSLLDVKWRSLLQVKRKQGSSLAALRRPGTDVLKAKVVPFLAKEAQRLHSAALLNLVQPAESGSLDGVKDMVEGMITKLSKEVATDSEQQTWCTSELKSNKKTRSAKTILVDELNADIDRLNASLISLGEDIVTMGEELLQLDKAAPQMWVMV
ncbi:unnamed protein product [Symbiodinium sp. CCMP2592]|nr:unnamed protein product [Symbiodinium sp. CCMP2592]